MTILNTVQAIGDIKEDFAVTGLLLLVGMIAFFVIAVCVSDRSLSTAITSFIIAIVCLASAVYIMAADSSHETYQKYECTINDDCTVNELLEKYDIVAQRGEIYVLRDKKQ